MTSRSTRSATTPEGPARRRSLPVATWALLAGLLCLLALGLPLLTGCGSETAREGDTISITIPAGTTDLVERGGSSKAVPELISGRVGDTLVVENNDSSTQFIAGYSVSPGQILKIPLNRSGSYVTNCSAHKDKSIRMEIAE